MISQIYSLETIKKGILTEIFTENIQQGEWEIVKSSTHPYTRLKHQDINETIASDSEIYITEYFNEIFDKSFSNILIAGLGLGILPYLCQSFCETIDIVEFDNDLITMMTQKGHLNNKVSIFQGNIFEFSTNKKYDVICFNIWLSEKTNDFENQMNFLKNRFVNNLMENGTIYIPIIDYYKKTDQL